MRFKIVTDSACDLSAEMIEALDLGIAALSVELDGRAYAEGEMTPKELYDHLRGGKLPKTSAVNPELWADAMRPALEQGQDVLTLVFSSALSATCQNAFIAAEELRGEFPDRKLIVIDSLCAAIGLGLLVHTAARLRDAGKSIEETAAWIEEHKLNVCHWVTVEDLMHLKRGGRVSAATAVVGTMLSIKPIIHVDDEGKLMNVGKVRGRKGAIEHVASKLGELGEGYNNETVYIVHGDCQEDAEHLASIVKEKYGVKNVLIGYVDGVIGAHTGPGVLALFFLGKHR